ncbi:MAG: hypothetical protein ABIQ99_11305, partial [Thermoflexales bacterium]
RRVKAKSALVGRTVREVTTELYQAWLTQEAAGASPEMSPEHWMDEWIRQGETALRDAPPAPTARQALEDDRNRQEAR